MKSKKYIKTLEDTIKRMLQPLKGVPLSLVIESISGCKVLSFQKNNKNDSKLLQTLIKAVEIAGKSINKNGIIRMRPNEVGNDIEVFVKDALNALKYKASIPKAKSGKTKSMGYPDLVIEDEFNRTTYLECKTFNIANLETTQRSFYLSPSEDFKVTKDARHLLISFEIYVAGRKNRNSIFKCNSWKILSIESLLTDVKYEFNADNIRLYSRDLILAEGRL